MAGIVNELILHRYGSLSYFQLYSEFADQYAYLSPTTPLIHFPNFPIRIMIPGLIPYASPRTSKSAERSKPNATFFSLLLYPEYLLVEEYPVDEDLLEVYDELPEL